MVTILTEEPTIEVLAEMSLDWPGIELMAKWVKSHRPECLPEQYNEAWDLFPWDLGDADLYYTHNEALVELAGRKCYDSFGLKAGRKTNAEYIAHTQTGDVPHASIMYHAKMTFFFAGISRRVSHELIRNYVGADRDEEGSPSQESTRFTHHYGFFVLPPRYIDDAPNTGLFTSAMEAAYEDYKRIIDREFEQYRGEHGNAPLGLARKRIYEAAAGFLPQQAETSFIWTTNPIALAKMVRERSHETADLEFQRFAKKLARICIERWPALFQQPWMKEACL